MYKQADCETQKKGTKNRKTHRKMSRFEKEILPFMEEEIMRKLRTYNVYSIKEYEDIRKAVRYSIRFCKKHKIVRCEDKNLNKERNEK